ncbi:AAA family ATPase [Bernardetia sp. OM2101]|uniref:AAA family ATPase n=1 Tax=Bernardetia sp. OM2101 TaxID=3344876 RepID=UPI0035CF1BA8
MEILIKNLGSIKNNKQTIDLSKKLYVFVGDNNSGKTYVSQLIWTLYNYQIQERFSRQTDIDFDFEVDSFEITKELVDEVLNKYLVFIEKELATTYNIENTPYKNTILSNFQLEFVYDINEVIEEGFEATLDISEKEVGSASVFKFHKKENSSQISITNIDIDKLPFDLPKNSLSKSEMKKYTFLSSIIKTLLDDTNTLFLPANRSFYATFYPYIYEIEREKREKEIAELRGLLDKKGNSLDLANFNFFKRPYTAPVNDLFEKLYDFNKNAKETENYPSLVNRISELMGGDISMNSLEGVSMIDFALKIKDTDKSLPMYLSSSSVNQLTLIYLYLKYWADKEDNFLLIDEPEENLNPKNQIKLLEILIDFANESNNKVLITTHSPIIAESINNYSYLDILKNELKLDVKEIIKENKLKHINSNTSIAKEDVGVYFFDGKKIIHYDDNEYGISFDNFREIETSMENNSKILTDYIYLQKQETTESNG